jgi:hypothetical protein
VSAAPSVPVVGNERRSVSMLMTKHFVFLHLPRTGGRFLREICFDHLPANWFVPNDLAWLTPYGELEEDYGDLPAFTLVRNPWDWYVSWYHHLTQHEPEQRSGQMWQIAFERGRADFPTVVTRACTGELFENQRTRARMQELDCDHYSALYDSAVGPSIESGKVQVLRYEAMRTDIEDFFERHEIPVGEGLLEALANGDPVAASHHHPYREYYDDDLRDLVGAKAQQLVTRHGYAF